MPWSITSSTTVFNGIEQDVGDNLMSGEMMLCVLLVLKSFSYSHGMTIMTGALFRRSYFHAPPRAPHLFISMSKDLTNDVSNIVFAKMTQHRLAMVPIDELYSATPWFAQMFHSSVNSIVLIKFHSRYTNGDKKGRHMFVRHGKYILIHVFWDCNCTIFFATISNVSLMDQIYFILFVTSKTSFVFSNIFFTILTGVLLDHFIVHFFFNRIEYLLTIWNCFR